MARRHLLVALTALTLAASGCANGDAMHIRFEPEDSSPVQSQLRLPVPVALGVRLKREHYHGFHNLVLQGLEQSGSFTEVRLLATPRDPTDGLDYVADLDYTLETGSRWYNYFTIFPGFVIFAPHWVHLRWDFDLTTKLRLRRGDHTEVGRFVRRDEHEMAYTSPGYAIASDLGWLGFIFLPTIGSPFVTGFVAAFNGSQAVAYRRRFFVSYSGRQWGARVAAMLTNGIEADLKSGGARFRPAGPRPLVPHTDPHPRTHTDPDAPPDDAFPPVPTPAQKK